jgi:PPOX class probable F420-dependent enzyme
VSWGFALVRAAARHPLPGPRIGVGSVAAVPVTVPSSHADLLERPLVCTLATTRPDGRPQANPMWFEWDGELVRFTHTSTRAKHRNLRHDPRASVLIFDTNDPHHYLELRGQVTAIEPDPDGSYFYRLAERYDDEERRQMTPERIDADHRVVLVFEPDAVIVS